MLLFKMFCEVQDYKIIVPHLFNLSCSRLGESAVYTWEAERKENNNSCKAKLMFQIVQILSGNLHISNATS